MWNLLSRVLVTGGFRVADLREGFSSSACSLES